MKQILSFRIILLFLPLLYLNMVQAQLTTPPSGGNKKASVSERIGITDVSIHYDRPGVKGREGKIWGALVPLGYSYLGFGSAKQSPWRAGANENTTIEFSTDVQIEGQNLPAGQYGFFIAYDPNECTIIFSKNSISWGSYYYDPKEDALQVKVKPIALEKSVEWLKYEFLNQTSNSAIIALEWEKLMIPFKVEVDLTKTQLASFRKELRTEKGFTWESWNQAAQWCVQKNINLDQALLWTDSATNNEFGGDQSFQAWNTKAQVLAKLGRNTEAEETMKKALPFGNEYEVYQYAKQLVSEKKNKEAFDAFKMNYDKHPNSFISTTGMARAYSAMGNYKKALGFVQKAQPLATDPSDKATLDKMTTLLKEGKDVN